LLVAISTLTRCVSATAPATLYSIGDAFVLEAGGDVNYGGNAALYSGYDDPADRVRSLVKFDMSNITATVETATLRLYYSSYQQSIPNGRASTAYMVTSTWSEMVVTWNTQPTKTNTDAASITVPASYGWVEYNVTNIVKAQLSGSNNGFVVYGPETGAYTMIGFNSREAANIPQLYITFASAPSSSSSGIGILPIFGGILMVVVVASLSTRRKS
jgi:hypothetical protein